MNVSFDYYKVFYYVAKNGSFTRAAEELFVNQPNVTRTVKTLEEQLGCTLFARSKRKVELTPEGEKLYRHIRIAFEHVRMGEEELLEDKNLNRGTVSIGASETALYGLLLPVLKKFRSAYEGVKLKVGNYTAKQAIAALNDGFVDFAVVTAPLGETTRLSVQELVDFREVAVCGNAFPELMGKTVSLRTLCGYPVVGLARPTMTFDFYTGQFAKYGLSYSPDIEVATADQILPMIQNDLGVGFVPEFFLSVGAGVHEISLKERVASRAICLVKRTDRPLSLAAKQFERELLACRRSDRAES